MQRSPLALAAVLARAVRVRVWASRELADIPRRAELLLETADPTELAELRQSLRLERTHPSPASPTGPSLELLDIDGLRVAVLVFGDGHTLHWDGFTEGPQRGHIRATQWLAARGVAAPFAAYRAYVLALKRKICEEDERLEGDD